MWTDHVAARAGRRVSLRTCSARHGVAKGTMGYCSCPFKYERRISEVVELTPVQATATDWVTRPVELRVGGRYLAVVA